MGFFSKRGGRGSPSYQKLSVTNVQKAQNSEKIIFENFLYDYWKTCFKRSESQDLVGGQVWGGTFFVFVMLRFLKVVLREGKGGYVYIC